MLTIRKFLKLQLLESVLWLIGQRVSEMGFKYFDLRKLNSWKTLSRQCVIMSTYLFWCIFKKIGVSMATSTWRNQRKCHPQVETGLARLVHDCRFENFDCSMWRQIIRDFSCVLYGRVWVRSLATRWQRDNITRKYWSNLKLSSWIRIFESLSALLCGLGFQVSACTSQIIQSWI